MTKPPSTTTQTRELEPCPFCPDGGKSYLNDVLYGSRVYDIAVRCRQCGCSSTEYGWASGLADTQDERYEDARRKAIVAWNTRAASSDTEQVIRLREALESIRDQEVDELDICDHGEWARSIARAALQPQEQNYEYKSNS